MVLLYPAITSKDNRLVKLYAKLSVSKSAREKEALFTIEGIKLLLEAVKSGLSVETVFLTEELLAKRRETLMPVLSKCGAVYLIPHELEAKLAQVETPLGVYAMVKKLDKTLSWDRIEYTGKSILLVDLQDAGNVGTIIRTAEALGVRRVCATAHTCDFYNSKVIRSAMGSLFRMELVTVPDAVSFMQYARKMGACSYASVVSDKAQSVGTFSFAKDSVLLIGNEGNGLSDEVAAAADHRVTIRMSGNTESLNASVAACILMWEMNQ